MKKQYINPEIEVIKINTTHLLEGSPKGVSDETPKEWGSRQGRDFWDDDEDF